MTPEERSALIEAASVIVDLLASYDVDRAIKLQADLKGRTLSDGEATRLATQALRVAGGELVSLATHFRAAIKMGSDYGAAFQAVQADAATEARRARKRRKAALARELRAAGLSIAQIALKMGVRERTVERYLAK